MRTPHRTATRTAARTAAVGLVAALAAGAAPPSATAAEPALSGATAVPTCVWGAPGARVEVEHRDMPPYSRISVRRAGREVGFARVIGSGRAGADVLLPPGREPVVLEVTAGPGPASTSVPVRVGTCDLWAGVADHNATSNLPIGPVDERVAVTVRTGVAHRGPLGWLYSTPLGVHAVGGAIGDAYEGELRGTHGELGRPTTSEFGVPGDPAVRYNGFEHGNVYWSPATGAHEVHGAVFARYAELGHERSALGLPVTHERPTPVRPGAYNHFRGGSLYWSPATGAHEVLGAIRDEWARRGWEASALGFPVTGERDWGGYRRSDFEGGYLLWSPAGGVSAHRLDGSPL
ncbi:LGFP repeat-containing protein [Kineococcus gypseus]|uniref:LGFP repeat-containing protein n=1 Tax=Kineococcus gypseus TaxID=1637102 RepID=UPI003D7E473F